MSFTTVSSESNFLMVMNNISNEWHIMGLPDGLIRIIIKYFDFCDSTRML